MRGARAVAALAVPVLLALGACSEADRDRAVDSAKGEARDRAESALKDAGLPSVDWKKYRDGVKEEIDKAAASADCEKLADELARVESRNSPVRDYIEARAREAGC